MTVFLLLIIVFLLGCIMHDVSKAKDHLRLLCDLALRRDFEARGDGP